MQDKISFRLKAGEIRRGLSEEIRNKKSLQIGEKLESLEAFKKATHVLFYYAVKEEVKTQKLIEKYLTLKKLYLPQILPSNEFQAIRLKAPLNLKQGLKGVPEPIEGEEAKELNVIIIPGVAFDKKGNRLGTGKGYYDRFLSRYPNSLKIGLAYEEQMVENLPQDPYDIPVDVIVTDQKIYFCKRS